MSEQINRCDEFDYHHEIIDDIGIFQHPRLADFTDFWHDRQRQRDLSAGAVRPSKAALPPRAAFDPIDMRRFLGDIYLLDVLNGPRRYRFRLIGTRIVEGVGRDFTGRFFDEVYGGQSLDHGVIANGLVVDRGKPVRIYGTARLASRGQMGMEAVLLPLSADGETVDMLMGMIIFGS